MEQQSLKKAFERAQTYAAAGALITVTSAYVGIKSLATGFFNVVPEISIPVGLVFLAASIGTGRYCNKKLKAIQEEAVRTFEKGPN